MLVLQTGEHKKSATVFLLLKIFLGGAVQRKTRRQSCDDDDDKVETPRNGQKVPLKEQHLTLLLLLLFFSFSYHVRRFGVAFAAAPAPAIAAAAAVAAVAAVAACSVEDFGPESNLLGLGGTSERINKIFGLFPTRAFSLFGGFGGFVATKEDLSPKKVLSRFGRRRLVSETPHLFAYINFDSVGWPLCKVSKGLGSNLALSQPSEVFQNNFFEVT